MESTRNIRRMIEREIKKGSAPLMFDHIRYPDDALQEIKSEEKLKEVLDYLFRIAEYEELANDVTRNNVYTEHHLIYGDRSDMRNNVFERNANYMNIMAYAKWCKPVYERNAFVETVPCYFSFQEEGLEQYSFDYRGEETVAFPLSGKHIKNGLYLMCIMSRMELAGTEAPDFMKLPEHQQIYHLADIRAVLFQCLLLDDMHVDNDGLYRANLHTIYLLK